MSKKKKKSRKPSTKVVRLSPEKYIKTKAHTLPIKECLITDEWQEMGLAMIVVTREQPSGNLVVGTYLVDTMCLGAKDAYYYQNMPHFEYNEMVEGMKSMQNMVSCEYVEAHNVIYGAIAFAEGFGFYPHKDFQIARHILEEDDEKVDLIEYEFGREGKPVLFVKDGMNPTKYISQLKKSVGEGNYDVVYQGEEWDEDDWDEDPFDFERPYRNFLKEYQMEAPPVRDVKEVRLQSLEISYEPMDSLYDEPYADDKEKLHDMITDTHQMVFDEEEVENAVPLLRAYIGQYPEYPVFYNHLIIALKRSGQDEEAKELAHTLYKKFPDYLYAKIGYGDIFLDEGKAEEAFEVMGKHYNIQSLYPDRTLFHYTELLAFNSFVCRYLLEKGELDKAVLYYRMMYSIEEDHPMTIAIEELLGTHMLKNKLGNMIEEGENLLDE